MRFLVENVAEFPVLRTLRALVPPSESIWSCPAFQTTDAEDRRVFAPALCDVVLCAENTSWDRKRGQIQVEEVDQFSRDLGLHCLRKEVRPKLTVEKDVTLVGHLARKYFTGFSAVQLDWQRTSILVPEAASRHADFVLP